MKNCYEMALRLFEVSEAVKVLGDKMSKSNSPNDIKIFSHQMDVLDKDIDKDDFDNSCSKKLDEILNKDEDNNHLGFKNSPLNFYYNITNDNGKLNTECILNGEDVKLDDLEKVLKGYLR